MHCITIGTWLCFGLLIITLAVLTFWNQPNNMVTFNKGAVKAAELKEDVCLFAKRPEETQLIYNMVPKCGSLGFRKLIFNLKKVNNFKIQGRNYNNPPSVIVPYHLSETGLQALIQRQFIHLQEPWLYYGHLDYINFTQAGYPFIKPSYINIVRDPIDRLVSFYCYRRDYNMAYVSPLKDVFAKDMETNLKRQNMDFNECVQSKDLECADPRFMFSMIPHFCGQDPMCIMPSECALAQAKRNAVSAFAVIGYLDNYDQFIEVVEYMFPQYFKGALQMYHNIISKNTDAVHKSKTRVSVTTKTKHILMKRRDIQLEYDFYKFVKQMFDLKYRSLNTC